MTALTTSPFFTVTAGSSLAHGSHDHIADVAELALGTAQNADGLDLLGAGIVGDLQIAFFLDHAGTSLFRLLDDLNHAPALVLGQGAGLHDADAVAHAALRCSRREPSAYRCA